MKKNIISAMFLSLFLLIAGCSSDPSQDTDQPGMNYCTQEQRNADACIDLYDPVCGWFDESIRCFAYPCAATYSNSCFACMDAKVDSWTEGECPKPGNICPEPQTDYETAIINLPDAEQVMQTHALCIEITLENGTIIHTKEPTIDDIFNKIQQCGKPCEDMILATE